MHRTELRGRCERDAVRDKVPREGGKRGVYLLDILYPVVSRICLPHMAHNPVSSVRQLDGQRFARAKSRVSVRTLFVGTAWRSRVADGRMRRRARGSRVEEEERQGAVTAATGRVSIARPGTSLRADSQRTLTELCARPRDDAPARLTPPNRPSTPARNVHPALLLPLGLARGGVGRGGIGRVARLGRQELVLADLAPRTAWRFPHVGRGHGRRARLGELLLALRAHLCVECVPVRGGCGWRCQSAAGGRRREGKRKGRREGGRTIVCIALPSAVV